MPSALRTTGAKPARENPMKKPKRGVGRNPTLVRGNPGNAGGKVGRSGRKPDDFKAACAGLADGVVLRKVHAYLNRGQVDADDPYFWKCAEYVTNYGKGKAPQSVLIGQDADAPPFRFTLNLGDAAIHEGDDE